MALISPSNLLKLHAAGKRQIGGLGDYASPRYSIKPKGGEPIIPDPLLFNTLPTGPGPGGLPTVSECAVHLCMLQAFYKLRRDVVHSKELDNAFGIVPKPRTVYGRKWEGTKYVAEKKRIKDDTFETRRRDKWESFLLVAAVRFHEWIKMVDMHLGEAASGSSQYFLLPPIDILAIWHAFLLNCDDFKGYCERRNLRYIHGIAFPWAEIHAAIDCNTWTYTLPEDHSDWLFKTAKIHPSLYDGLAEVGKAKTRLQAIFSVVSSFASSSKEDSSHPLNKTMETAELNKTENMPLVANVQRQCIFVDKMHAHRWIRSPAAEGTLRRAVDRYDKFLHLFHLYPNRFLVPTLDVDLVWHTHQCSADNYRTFVTERVGRFINHEDKIGRGTLDDGFSSAEELYRLQYGMQYQVCLCWSCEAILSEVEKLDDLDDETQVELAKDIEHKLHYYRELEISRRLDRDLPIWKHRQKGQDQWNDVWT
ncbi:hypothetical protein BJX99DRAFT_226225 [Aspergillus californicus]